VAEERVAEAKVPDGALLRFGKTEVRFAAVSSWEPVKKPVATPAPPREIQRDTLKADTTLSARIAAAREADDDPLALALRPAAVLRVSLHAAGVAGVLDAGARIRAALDACAGAITDEGGVASRLSGVGVLGLFGLAGPDPAEGARALRAARAARARVRELGGLDVRAGIDIGQVLAGNAGSGAAGWELAALGLAADRAERLAALAAPGEILAGVGAAASDPSLHPSGTVDMGGTAVDVFKDEPAPA
jgi:class 3 adenylate cyclase